MKYLILCLALVGTGCALVNKGYEKDQGMPCYAVYAQTIGFNQGQESVGFPLCATYVFKVPESIQLGQVYATNAWAYIKNGENVYCYRTTGTSIAYLDHSRSDTFCLDEDGIGAVNDGALMIVEQGKNVSAGIAFGAQYGILRMKGEQL